MSPDTLDNSTAHTITIEGESFVPRIEGNLAAPSEAKIHSHYRVVLTHVDGSERVWEAVAPRNPLAIDITIPAAFARGIYGIHLTDPHGRQTARDRALRSVECFIESSEICKLNPSEPLSSANKELAEGEIVGLAKDATGSLWVITDSGVVGRQPVNGGPLQPFVPPKHAPVATILTDAAGNVWFGHDERGCSAGANATCACGPSHVPADGEQATTYCTDYLTTAMNYVTVMVLDPDTGNIYMGTGNDYGIYKADLDTIECDINFAHNENAYCTAGAVDNRSPRHLWMGTRAGLFEFTPDHEAAKRCNDTWIEHRPFGDGVLPHVSAVLFDHGGTDGRTSETLSDDTVWVATLGAGIARLGANDTSHSEARVYSTADGIEALPSDNVYSLALHPARRILFAGTAAGLLRYDLESNVMEVLTEADGLPSRDVRALAIDAASRTLWIGTSAGVVSSPIF